MARTSWSPGLGSRSFRADERFVAGRYDDDLRSRYSTPSERDQMANFDD